MGGRLPALRARLAPYAWLAKVDVRGYLMAVPVAATALEPSLLWDGLPALLLLLPLELCVFATVVTLDDVQGARDGSDAINYADSSSPRTQRRKPIVAGLVTEQQALAFARILVVAVGVLIFLAWLASPDRPGWFIAGYALLAITSFQYSFGIRLSYRFMGGAELVQGGATAGCVLLAYYLVAGEITSLVLVEAFLVGIWHIQIGSCANAHDRDGDRQAGRRTFAVAMTDPAYRRWVAGVFSTGWLLLIVSTAAGWVPLAVPIMVLPAILLQIRALRLGPVGGNWLRARRQCFLAVYTGALGLVLANVLAIGVDLAPFDETASAQPHYEAASE